MPFKHLRMDWVIPERPLPCGGFLVRPIPSQMGLPQTPRAEERRLPANVWVRRSSPSQFKSKGLMWTPTPHDRIKST